MRSVRSPFVVTTSKSSNIWRNYEAFDIDYEVVQELGAGGFGKVLLVRNRKRNVQFAMKELEESGPDSCREVELMVTLTRTNPHVVSYFDRFVRTVNGVKKYCIMMDYVRGVNMHDYVKKGKPINNTVVYWFLKSALEALSHLHEMRISHRDIKPENYIVAPYRLEDESGTIIQRLVTIDFGLGSFLKREGRLYVKDAEEIVGTPNYSSPQMIDFDNAGKLWLDAKSDDVWALGASFYYLCTGKHVAEHRKGDSWSRPWKEVLNFQCPKVVWEHHTLLNEIITLALSKDHQKRPSAAELLQMLVDNWDANEEECNGSFRIDNTTPLKTSSRPQSLENKAVSAGFEGVARGTGGEVMSRPPSYEKKGVKREKSSADEFAVPAAKKAAPVKKKSSATVLKKPTKHVENSKNKKAKIDPPEPASPPNRQNDNKKRAKKAVTKVKDAKTKEKGERRYPLRNRQLVNRNL